MFSRDEFMSYVGSASGSSYAAGLKAIESIYGVDIDGEYAGDKCRNLFQKLEQDKRSTELNKTELKRRSDMTSHLKKYVEYRENATAIEQRKRFVSWMQGQPRRDDPTKKYSVETIHAAADKLQSGLKKLGVSKYAEVNCFAVTDPEYFAELHKACYAKAEESDKKQGHRDFRNGLDFYMQFLSEQNNANIIPASPMQEKIKLIIAAYKADFERVNQEERYKWEAVGCYWRNWDIEAENFAQMYAEAFKEASNLLAANMYWPYKMVVTFAEQEPDKVRELFRLEKDFLQAERYVSFELGENYLYDGIEHNDSGNSTTFSDEFIKQYQAICSEVDVILKSICTELGNTTADDMQYGYTPTILQNWTNIISQKVKFKDVELQPFSNWKHSPDYKSPDWWTPYNKVKHKRVHNYRKANLKNVVNALAGLYILENYFVKYIGDRDNDMDVPNDISVVFEMIDFETREEVLGRNQYTITTQDIDAICADVFGQ